MELLNEKRIRPEYLSEQDKLLKCKISLMEEQMEQLKRSCMLICNFHKYDKRVKNYSEILYDAKEQWLQIWQCDWKEHQQILDIFKAKACCFIGGLFVCRQNYDDALDYLNKGACLIETGTLQYIIPEFYVSIQIKMAECHIAKHSSKRIIEKCLNRAEKVLRAKESDIAEEYPEVLIQELSLELKFQQIFLLVDQCSETGRGDGQTEEPRSGRTVSRNGFNADVAEKTWKILGDIQELYCRLPEKPANIPAEISLAEEFDYSAWKQKKSVTLFTTKGEFFKSLYFLLDDMIDILKAEKQVGNWNLQRDLRKIAGLLGEELAWQAPDGQFCCRGRMKPEHYAEVRQELTDQISALERGYEGIVPSGVKNAAQKQQWYCLEIAIMCYAETIRIEPKNTISLDDMAALLFDCYYNTSESLYLLSMIACYCPEKYQKSTVAETVDAILDSVLTIDRTNMFALHVKAAQLQGDSAVRRIQDYPALRQSSLKKWFVNMTKKCDEKDKMQKIQISLIKLYSQVNEFMQSAIIDCDSKEWEGLEIGHYTRMAVLPKLFKKESNARLRIHNVHHLNDPREGVILINYLKEICPPRGEEDSLIEELWKTYDSDQRGAVRSSVYMGSFTSRLDQINMWEQYGDHKKGVSLQLKTGRYFDREAEISLAELSTSGSYGHYKRENVKYPLYMVIYLPDKGERDLTSFIENARRKLQETPLRDDDDLEEKWQRKQWELADKFGELTVKLESSLKEIQAGFRKLSLESQAKVKTELCNTIMVIFDLVRFLIKSDYYMYEQEYRVIQYSADPECASDSTVVPKLYIPIERELVYEKIYLGPLVNDFESKAAYILNLRRNCTDEQIEVRKSEIAFKEE